MADDTCFVETPMLIQSVALTTLFIKLTDQQSKAAPPQVAGIEWLLSRQHGVISAVSPYDGSDSEVLSSLCAQAKQQELKQSSTTTCLSTA